MSKSSIYQKIEEKGRLEAQAIRSAGISKADAARKKIMDEATTLSNNQKADATAKCDDALKTNVTQFYQQSKQDMLAVKKQLIHSSFEKALDELLEINDEELKKVVIKYIRQNELSGNEKLHVKKNDYNRYLNLFSTNKNGNDLDILNKLLSTNGKKYSLSLSGDPVNITGGFIIEGSSFDIDNSFETILKDLEETMEAEIASLLFAKEA